MHFKQQVLAYLGNWLNTWVLLVSVVHWGQHWVNQLEWQALEQLHLLCHGEIGMLHRFLWIQKKICNLFGTNSSVKKKEMKDLKVAFDAADTNHDERLSQKELYIKLKMEGQNPSWYGWFKM